MHVLAHTHAPQNHGALGAGKRACHLAQGLRRYATNRLHRFGAVTFDVLTQRLVVAGALGNKVLVGQALFNHHMDERVEHGHIGISLELQGAPGVFADVGNARIGQHNFGATLGRVFHPGCSDGMVGCGVGADDKNQV